MRIHVAYQGKKTTISIEEQLIDYLGALLVADIPRHHSNAKKQIRLAIDFIRNQIAEFDQAGLLPSENLSQFMRQRIINLIAEQRLIDILILRGEAPKKRTRDNGSKQGKSSPEEVEKAFEKLKEMVSSRR